MLSPLSVSPAMSPDEGLSDAVTFMSGSGITMVGSSPGCQRSMLSSEPPSDVLPKNRLAVLILKPSRARGSSTWIAPGELFRSSSGWASSDSEMLYVDSACGLYCGSGGAFIAACNSGSSGADFDAGAVAVFAPMTEELEVAGSSRVGGTSSGSPVSGSTTGGVATTRRSPFSVRSTLGKSEG